MQRRYATWRTIDRSMTAFMPISEAEQRVKDDDARKPVSIVVPTSYANLQVLLTYHMSALLEEPIFKYDGIGPEDIPKAILMEHLVNVQAKRSKMVLDLHTMGADAYKYGFGVVHCGWEKRVTRRNRSQRSIESQLLSETSSEPEFVERVLFEGNVLRAIDPYNFLPDVNFQVHEVQRMEFVGWFDRTSYYNLLKDEFQNKGEMFNARYVDLLDGQSTFTLPDGAARQNEKTRIDKQSSASTYAKPVDVVSMFVDLIPSQWELGSSDYPETWFFRLAGDEVLLEAGPIELDHGMKPLAVMSPDFDGHSALSVSRMEIDNPMQEAINWLYNSHITNLRKAVNNMLVVDPGLANYNDVIDTKEGAVIRMRRPFWGMGRVRDAVAQLPINDVTRANLQDIQILMGFEDRVTGAQEPISGALSQKKERVSASESRQAALASVSRLEKDARISWVQAYQDLSYMMAYHNIQLLDNKTFVKLNEGVVEQLRNEFGEFFNKTIQNGRAEVDPTIFENFQFDVIPSDGTIPGSHSDPSSLVQFYQIIAGNPEVSAQFDIVRITRSIARRLNIKEVDAFSRNMQATVLPDQQVAEGVSNGGLTNV